MKRVDLLVARIELDEYETIQMIFVRPCYIYKLRKKYKGKAFHADYYKEKKKDK